MKILVVILLSFVVLATLCLGCFSANNRRHDELRKKRSIDPKRKADIIAGLPDDVRSEIVSGAQRAGVGEDERFWVRVENWARETSSLIKDTARKAVKAVKDWARCFFKRKCDNPEHIPPPPNPQDFVTIPPRDGDERETEEDLTSANPGPAPPTESNEPDTTGGTIQITWYDDNNKVGVDGKPIDKGVPGVITSDGGTSAELARMQQQKQTKKNR